MKSTHRLAATAVLTLGIMTSLLTRAAITGQWDFNSGDLAATVGADLTYRGDTSSSTAFTTSLIGGQTANVMMFPATSPTQGYTMTHGVAPNGGGSYVNQYTLLWTSCFQRPAAEHDAPFFKPNATNLSHAVS